MKILWLTSQFPSDQKSIKGIYLYRTVRYLSKYYDIETWCFYPSVPPIFSMLKNPAKCFDIYKYWKSNIPNSDVSLPGIDSKKLSFITYPRLPRTIIQIWEAYFILRSAKQNIKNLNKDYIIHSNWIFPSGHLAYILSKKMKIPYSVSLLGTDVHNLKYGTFYWRTAKRILENANYVSSVSEELLNRCRNEKIYIPEEKSILIDNVYDTERFKISNKSDLRKRHNLNDNLKIIFYAGGLVEIKNVDVLLNAFSQVNDPKVKLIIAGKGAEESNLKKLANTTVNSHNIMFVGNLQDEVLVEYFNMADIFTLPSKNEGTPNVIVEALLCGIPVVASNVGGIPKLIDNGKNGILVEPNSIDSLANGLIEALNTSWDRTALRNSVTRFFPENALKSYSKLFDTLEKSRVI